jgi:hypothetical protein
METVTIIHLRDLASGKRRIIPVADVRVIQLPHYIGLEIASILKWATNHNGGVAMQALPEREAEVFKLPRSYIANVIRTIAGVPFKDWTKQQVEVRNAKVTQEHNMNIDLDPKIAAIFR